MLSCCAAYVCLSPRWIKLVPKLFNAMDQEPSNAKKCKVGAQTVINHIFFYDEKVFSKLVFARTNLRPLIVDSSLQMSKIRSVIG